MIGLEEDFRFWLQSDELAKENIRNHIFHFREFCKFCEVNGVTIELLGIEVSRAYLVWLQERPNLHNGKPLSLATRGKHFQTLTRIGRFLREKNLYSGPELTEGIRPPVRKRSIIHGFTQEQLQAIINAIATIRTTPRYRERMVLLIFLLSTTGLRISEALTLTVNKIDLYRRIMVVLGKGSKEREVPISFELAELIRHYIDRYNIGREELLLASRYGKPMHTSTIRDALRKAKLSLGTMYNIDQLRVSPHTFRHTFARMWVSKGGNTIALSRIMGHESMQMTFRYVQMWGVDLNQAYDACSPGAGIKIPTD